jgi:hypothetical protein
LRSERFNLVSDQGEQVPAGDYFVHVRYENPGPAAARQKDDTSARARDTYPADALWTGVVQSAVFPVHVAAKAADTTYCELPTRMEFVVHSSGQVMWRWDKTSFEPAVLVSRPGFHLGCQTALSEYVGEDRGSTDSTTAAEVIRTHGRESSRSLGGIPDRDRASSSMRGLGMGTTVPEGKKLGWS